MEATTDYKINTSYFETLFSENRNLLFSHTSDFYNKLRDKAMGEFMQKGFPDAKTEAYRYTDFKTAFQTSLSPYFNPKPILFKVDDIFRCDVPDLDTTLIMLVNGFYHGDKKMTCLPNGLIYGSLKQAMIDFPELVKKHYSSIAKDSNDPFSALNSAFASDGLFLYIPDNLTEVRPIQIINLLLSDEALMVHHRNLIVLEENTGIQLVICDHSLSPHAFFTNSVYEVLVGKNSHLDFIRMQNEHNKSGQVSSVFIRQDEHSSVTSNTITLHGGFIRNNFFVELAGQYAENFTYGLFLADKSQHISNFTEVEHRVADCSSNQQFKGVLDDQSAGSFHGKILVQRDAQNTIAYQANKNLLLTDEAVMNTKPQLEIYADDVKCSHGATIGQLDENAMFYLQSRGISRQEARLLMMFGFAHDIISKIKIPSLRERIDNLVDLRLRGELSRCHNCPMHCC